MPNKALHQVNVLRSVVVSTLSAWRGTSVVMAAIQPKKLLKLYDMEGCPYCKRVREVLTALGLDAEIYPCPKGGKRFRPEAMRLGGKQQFPLLVDPNTATVLYEAAEIVDYLFITYGKRNTPSAYTSGSLAPMVVGVSSWLQGTRGITARKSSRPTKLLELWSFESSPYSRLVRERLTELELAYVLRNLGKEQFADMGPAVQRIRPGPYKPLAGGRREKVLAELGRVQVPYLVDPNTGVKLYESADIIDYLERQYAK
jgi:glutathione S-transferase